MSDVGALVMHVMDTLSVSAQLGVGVRFGRPSEDMPNST